MLRRGGRAAWEAQRLAPHSRGALTHADLSVWAIDLVERSDGPTVEGQLNMLCETTGQTPRAILSDCGGDLSAGIGRFCAAHPQTIPLKDLPHFAANLVKQELTDDPQWTTFLATANQMKTRLRQTKFAFLLPPDLKAKARWMNLDPLLTWSVKVADFVDAPRPVPGVSWEERELEEKMNWIRSYRPALARWSRLLAVVGVALKYIRQQGYHSQAAAELKEALAEWQVPPDSPAQRAAQRLRDYVAQQSQAIPAGEHLLGTSEVLESLLGKAKQLQARQSKSGFTKMILGIAASVTQRTTQTITAALGTIKLRHIADWLKTNLPASVQAQRFHALHASAGEQK